MHNKWFKSFASLTGEGFSPSLNQTLYTKGGLVYFPHWQHFLSLEKDFIETIEFVELDAANDGTFSVAYTKLLLAICLEVDVVAKLVCKKINPASSARNIDDYRQEITGKYSSFHTVECMISPIWH